MATAPEMFVYEITPGQPSRKAGVLMTPDQFYALALAMSFVEDEFLDLTEKHVRPFVEIYKDIASDKSPAIEEVFTSYCTFCNFYSRTHNRVDWRIDPNDFTRGVRNYLTSTFLVSDEFDAELAMAVRPVYLTFGSFIKHYEEIWDNSLTLSRLSKILIRLAQKIYHLIKTPPVCQMKMEKVYLTTAREALERIDRIGALAMDQNRVFSFMPPQDEVEQVIKVGDSTHMQLKDGTLIRL